MIKQQSYDKTLDYYSLGIVLFELLYGFPPFYSRSFEELKFIVLHSEITFPSEIKISKEAIDLIQKLTIKDYRKRIGFTNGLEEILSHPWLLNLNIEAIKKKMIKPPLIPNIYEINFDQEFINKDIHHVDEVCSEDPQEKIGLYDRFSNFSFSIDDFKGIRPSLQLTNKEIKNEDFEMLSFQGRTCSEKLPYKKKSKIKLKIFNEEFKKELDFLTNKKNNPSKSRVNNVIFEGNLEDVCEEGSDVQKIPKSKEKHLGDFLKKDEVPFIANDISSIKSLDSNEDNKKIIFKKDLGEINESPIILDQDLKHYDFNSNKLSIKKLSSGNAKDLNSSYHTAIDENKEDHGSDLKSSKIRKFMKF